MGCAGAGGMEIPGKEQRGWEEQDWNCSKQSKSILSGAFVPISLLSRQWRMPRKCIYLFRYPNFQVHLSLFPSYPGGEGHQGNAFILLSQFSVDLSLFPSYPGRQGNAFISFIILIFRRFCPYFPPIQDTKEMHLFLSLSQFSSPVLTFFQTPQLPPPGDLGRSEALSCPPLIHQGQSSRAWPQTGGSSAQTVTQQPPGLLFFSHFKPHFSQ